MAYPAEFVESCNTVPMSVVLGAAVEYAQGTDVPAAYAVEFLAEVSRGKSNCRARAGCIQRNHNSGDVSLQA